MQHVVDWFNHYGYGVLILGLMLELLALPLPGEVIMGYAGFLVFQGKLNWLTSIVFAGIGSSVGITLSYLIGFRLGTPFFHKYGHYIHFGPERLEKVSGWFSRYGNKLLVIAYFIPGVRHFTGYFSGINRLPFRTFALYAYTGAVIWVSTFISLGKILGPQWEHFHGLMTRYLLIAAIIAGVVVALYLIYKQYKLQIKEAVFNMLVRLLNTFHSLGRVRFLVTATVIIGVIFFVLMIGLIQDYLAHEFDLFDQVVMTLMTLIFDESWALLMRWFSYLASLKVLITFAILTFLGIIRKGQDRKIEVLFLFLVFLGGELFEEGLRRVFHRLPPVIQLVHGHTPYTFPSEYALMVFVVYGYSAFLLIRHSESHVRTIAVGIIFFLVVLSVGLSRLYFTFEYPSDVVAGYVFGGVWLSLNIVLLEINRLIYKL
ncbi:bifunctional DedA family/phosphatase PAP2 family protein [Aneurinibacillus terranovensis]|uniref:bifunctional DedA family/phosphatase PAP2 family protein n=1 Tax=Aneurinibacillus terranovensis TaxID=278991 RepID=UPI000401EFD8|nr:bifunctional DedA family/phosphatase PAP2 family protein [Aneurinibacillus terranovensis]